RGQDRRTQAVLAEIDFVDLERARLADGDGSEFAYHACGRPVTRRHVESFETDGGAELLLLRQFEDIAFERQAVDALAGIDHAFDIAAGPQRDAVVEAAE